MAVPCYRLVMGYLVDSRQASGYRIEPAAEADAPARPLAEGKGKSLRAASWSCPRRLILMICHIVMAMAVLSPITSRLSRALAVIGSVALIPAATLSAR